MNRDTINSDNNKAKNIVDMICLELNTWHTHGMTNPKDIYETVLVAIGLIVGILVVAAIPLMFAFLLYIGWSFLAWVMIGCIGLILLDQVRQTQRGE